MRLHNLKRQKSEFQTALTEIQKVVYFASIGKQKSLQSFDLQAFS